MKQLFRRLQRRRQRRQERTTIPKPNETIPIPIVTIAPHNPDDATTISRYTVDSRGHFVPNQAMDESILQVAISGIEMAIRMPLHRTSQQTTGSVSYHEQHATMAVEEGKWDAAMFHYEHALYHLGDSSTWDTELLGTIATILNNLAYAHQLLKSDQRQILHLYGAALTIKRYVYGKFSESTAKTLNNLGSTHYIFRQFHDAASYYEEARDILRLLPNANHLANEIATISSNLGDVHFCLKQFERANMEYRSSLRLRWNLFDNKEHPKITRLLEQIASTEQKTCQIDDASTVSSGRSNGSWQQEIQQLQTELSVDLEFFDSLEHSVPIQMAKEKAIVFRELRHLTDSPGSNVTPTTSCMNGPMLFPASFQMPSPVHVVSPDTSHPSLQDLNSALKTPQSDCKTIQCENDVSLSPCFHREEEAAVKSRPQYETVVSEASLECDRGKGTNLAKPNTIPTIDTLEATDDDSKKVISLQCSTTTSTTESCETPPATPLRRRPITSPKLTSNERHAALMDVKARLAQLRASRKPNHESAALAYV